MTDRPNEEISVAVVGMGYVGMTLASVLAEEGFRVHGVETNPTVRDEIMSGRLHLYEPGVERALANHIGKNWTVSEAAPSRVDVAIICVGTPLGPSHRPDLDYVQAATEALLNVVNDDSLVLVRSTVPLGTTRTRVHAILAARYPSIRVAHCPERTIQGQALREIRELPQVIGPIDEPSRAAAEGFFGRFAPRLVPVSSPEASELVKLANNSHTDVIYGFGNEIAMIAGLHGLDPLEVIQAANIDYPRPELSKPGFVGGGCLTKDPYILLHSLGGEYDAPIITSARRVNEAMPYETARQTLEAMRSANIEVQGARVLICGFAYKGTPATDDTRGSAAPEVVQSLAAAGADVVGHDFLVPRDVIRAMGAEPASSLEAGFRDASAVVILIDHPEYKSMELDALLALTRRPVVVYDAWRIFRAHPAAASPGVVYRGLGARA